MKIDGIGYIYILTNESFHRSNWIKIGFATDLERRVKELSNTSVPIPYKIYATYEVPLSKKMPDKAFHVLIHKLNPGLKITENREFFEIEPWDAYELLQSMAIIHNRVDKLKRYEDNKIGLDLVDEEKEDYSIEALFGDSGDLRSLFEKIKGITKEFAGELNIKPLKNYVAFKRNKKHNVIALWPKANAIEVVLNAKLGSIKDDTETIYDISNRLWPSAQYAFRFDEFSNIEAIKKIIEDTYKLKNNKE
jgi:predicted transport protein